jgi:hypothetical protein
MLFLVGVHKMNTNDLSTFRRYETNQLAAMGRIYYGGKANPYQTQKYELVRDSLFAELKSIWPDVPIRFAETNALYLHQMIERVIWENNQHEAKNARTLTPMPILPERTQKWK